MKALKEKGTAIQDSIKELFGVLYEEREGTQGIREDPKAVNAQTGLSSWYLGSSWDAPTENERTAVRQSGEATEAFVSRVNAFFQKEWPPYMEAVDAAKLSLVDPYVPVIPE